MLQFACSLLLANALCTEPPRFLETLYPYWGQTFTIDREILRQQTEHQDLLIFENERFGRVLTLDGVVQLTEADEAVYHEMITHVPLLTHENPTSVLIIGGGDGGTLREVLKHSSVQRVVLVRVDPSVIALSQNYLPTLSRGAFADPRLDIVIQDAAAYVTATTESFDVILCDSTDPIGPGEVLFTSEFYKHCKERLNPKGIFVNQNGAPFLQREELEITMRNRAPYFLHVGFYVAPVPTYVGGFMAFGWASDEDYQVSEETLRQRAERLGDLFYYTPQMHRAAFSLPQFMLQQVLQ